ncbi:hypothetical protein HHK36_015835 [Tetracentron sinense]|uniref:TITAN-like protein n=1 Tax=Tetracentron sinense TaxID=13715 RepID=A0A835DD70_TETSI|nr:hypothetical protein HHK36_015835 [Tetracentron sinense]
MKDKKNKKSEFEFCKVCNLNHNQGRRHNYFPNHTKSLSSFLSRFLQKLSDVQFFLKNPTPLRPEHASRNRLWCVFCDSDVDELHSFFACSNAINHLASSQHLKNLKGFLWKHGGGMDRVGAFSISEADLAKWEKRCKLLKGVATTSSQGFHGPSNDIHNELDSDKIDKFNNNTIQSFKSNLSYGVLPLQCFTNERYQVSHPEVLDVARVDPFSYAAISLPVGTHGNMDFQGIHVVESTTKDSAACSYDDPVCRNSQHSLIDDTRKDSVGSSLSNGEVHQVERKNYAESSYQGIIFLRLQSGCLFRQSFVTQVPRGYIVMLQNFTHISPFVAEEPKRNVHSGAPPPWFEANEENQQNVEANPGLRMNSLPSLLDKSRKSCKLNPKRVGAAWAEKRKIELEMENRGEMVPNNCDADWLPNFGRVWQSGTRKESRKEFETEKQKLMNVDSLSETPIHIQPYISKRMRRDASGSNGAVSSHLLGTDNVL